MILPTDYCFTLNGFVFRVISYDSMMDGYFCTIVSEKSSQLFFNRFLLRFEEQCYYENKGRFNEKVS